MKEEITSEIKNLLAESQREMLKLLKPEIKGNTRENTEEEVEEETRNFYTPTKSVRISSTQNDPSISRNSSIFKKILTSAVHGLYLFPDFDSPFHIALRKIYANRIWNL